MPTGITQAGGECDGIARDQHTGWRLTSAIEGHPGFESLSRHAAARSRK